MMTLIELAEKDHLKLSDTEKQALESLEVGQEFGNGENKVPSKAPTWGPERTIGAVLIRWLCSNPETVEKLTPYGIHLQGNRIEGQLKLDALHIPFNISLRKCCIPYPLDLRHSSVAALDLSGSFVESVEADGLIVCGEMRMAEGFRAEGPVSLKGAVIKGDLSCAGGCFINQGNQKNTPMIAGCVDCKASSLHAYALILERAQVEGSLDLCGGFSTNGGVHLGDTTIGVNLNCTKGRFTAGTPNANLKIKMTGRRLACDTDAKYHLACAFNGEGMHIKGNLIMNWTEVEGEMRLTGALIDKDLDSAYGKYVNRGGYAIHGDRLRVRGNVFFCDPFEAEGAIRLPRAEIGADISFCNGSMSNSLKGLPILSCEGIRVQGTVYLKNFVTDHGFIDLSYSTIGGNLDCTDSRFQGADGWALKAKGMEIRGSAFMSSSADGNFLADGLVGLTGSKLGMDLICTDGHFRSDQRSELENNTPCAIKADNMVIGGRVEMSGRFKAEGGVNFDDTNISSFLNCDQGTFCAPPPGGNYDCAISGGKLQVGGSIYLGEQFDAKGEIMLNDASIGRNLNCSNGKITNEAGYTLRAEQMKVAGSVNMDNFESHGEVRIDIASIGGDFNCAKGKFVNYVARKPGQDGEGKCFALHANGVNIAGCAEFKDGFHADGVVSLQNSNIGRHFLWTQIKDPAKASLLLDSTKVGVLVDDKDSWPARLQINDFEYEYLDELSPETFKSRRKKWLRLSPDFRVQPFEQLAAVLRQNGYEEEAKNVLIEKNKVQTELPVRWPWGKWLDRRCPSKDGNLQGQSPLNKILRVLFGSIVCYGYKPSKALWYGLIFVAIGWRLFYLGFDNKLMMPIKEKKENYFYQTAKFDNVSGGAIKDTNKSPIDQAAKTDNAYCGTKLMTTIKGNVIYSLVYSIDTFLPVVNLQTKDYWLPTAYPCQVYNRLGFWLCIYRWVLIVSGWVITSFFVAALSGVVRK